MTSGLSTTARGIVATIVTSMVMQIIAPSIALALTGGPVQPEFSNFEPVATTNMVNEFTGQFTYNLPVVKVPGPNGSGYALSLSYHSGTSPEEEASWVGYGWTINAGSIVRNTRGIPDEYKGAPIKYWNKVPANWTVSVGANMHVEGFSYDFLGAGTQASLRYNNYRGFGYTLGAGLDAKGIVNLGYSVSDGEGSFSVQINPAAILNAMKKKTAEVDGVRQKSKEWGAESFSNRILSKLGSLGYSNGMYSLADVRRPTNITESHGFMVKVSVGVQGNVSFLPVGGQGSVTGSYVFHENVDSVTENAYGYMYSSEATDEDIMDYYVEREGPFTKRDSYLPIPFAAADNYMISGEGIGGGIRLYNSGVGSFHPNSKESLTGIGTIGGEVNVGVEFGLGFDASVGGQVLTVGGWGVENADYQFSKGGNLDEGCFFRMNNDLGGQVITSTSDQASRANITEDYAVDIDNSIAGSVNGGVRSRRSNHIGYTTNKSMRDVSRKVTPNYYRSFNKQLSRYFVDRYTPDASYPDSIPNRASVGEMSVVSADGNRYVYGLPVYARNERNLQYGIEEAAQLSGVIHRGLTPRNADIVVGEERREPYASSYLITEITTPDYVDVDYTGPTDNDLGGFTKFDYFRMAGTHAKTDHSDNWSKTDATDNNSWYRWRVPYNGLQYVKNKMSDASDDMGVVSTGEREVYYLKSIETKTHIAVFITNSTLIEYKDSTIAGSGEDRLDGYEAPHFEYVCAGTDTSAAGSGTPNSNKLLRLERIELYAKNGDKLGKLIQTVHFDYDYSLCTGLPNSFENTGKLTLRRVYFEYHGVVNAMISPYVFGYEYKVDTDYNELPSEVETKYGSIISYGNTFTNQNPTYASENIDRWGNYQEDGEARADSFMTWVDQTPDTNTFDPAAWQLKSIQLPSGGEIHVQYEQHTYGYVQDRPAMAMVGLRGIGPESNSYYVRLKADLDIPEPSDQQKEMLSLITKRFREGGEKMAFRFLYPTNPLGSPASCDVEFVDGYANVTDAGIDAGGLWIELGDEAAINNSTPVDVMNSFLNANRGSIHDGGCGQLAQGVTNNGDLLETMYSLLAMVGKVFGLNLPSETEPIMEYSHLRLPLADNDEVYLAKKGGGCRVKRLLLYDRGVEDSSAGLYGSEYLYERTDGATSGVACNEPATGRIENALVGYLEKRTEQTWYQKAISGRDKEQFEGPLGESVLPSAFVGYSRVVSRNIHSGITNPGFTVSEFYTSKDYPFDASYNTTGVTGRAFDHTPIEEETDWLMVPQLFVNYRRANVYATQGYRFVLTSMNGQVHRVTTYAGNYANTSEWTASSSQEIEYFQPGEQVRMMYGPGDFRNEFPGKEMEVTLEGRSVEDVILDASIEYDAGVGTLIPPVPWWTLFGSISYSEEKLNTHVTVKVIRYPVIQKSVTIVKDGIRHRTENIAFNPDNGMPIVTRTWDGYAGLDLQQSPTYHNRVYQSYAVPATWEYPGMGQKAFNEQTILTSTSAIRIDKSGTGDLHYLTFRISDPVAACNTLEQFCGGDLVWVYKGDRSSPTRNIGLFNVDKVVGNRLMLLPTTFSYNVLSDSLVSVEIIRSGCTNQLGAAVGAYTTYDEPQP